VAANALGEITPTSLLQGYGEKACTLVNLLCDAAVAKTGQLWRPFVYPDESAVVAGGEAEEEDEDDVMEVRSCVWFMYICVVYACGVCECVCV
jgi:hypothetical protein